jgi:hypothetical protein
VRQRYDVSMQVAMRTFAEAHPRHAFILMFADVDAGLVRPQWASPGRAWAARWWTGEAVQRLPKDRVARALYVPNADGRRVRFAARWLPERRQAVLVAAAKAGS